MSPSSQINILMYGESRPFFLFSGVGPRLCYEDAASVALFFWKRGEGEGFGAAYCRDSVCCDTAVFGGEMAT